MCPQHGAHRLPDDIPVYYSRLFTVILKGLSHSGFSFILFVRQRMSPPSLCDRWPQKLAQIYEVQARRAGRLYKTNGIMDNISQHRIPQVCEKLMYKV